MEFPITTDAILEKNRALIINKAKDSYSNDKNIKRDYFLYNYILIRMLYLKFENQENKFIYKSTEEFLKKILSVEGTGKCMITIRFLLNQNIKNKNIIHTILYNIMNQEIILQS